MDRVESKPVGTLNEKVKVYRGESFLCDARCRLRVSQDVIVTTRGEREEGHESIEGTISECDPDELLGVEDLTMHFGDGRRLKFFVKNNRGAIRASGGFYHPEAD